MVSQKKQILIFWEHSDDVRRKLSAKRVVVFLDYDGTLTPIVATPDLAVLSDGMRAVLKDLTLHNTVAVVSGRATEDVRAKVGINGIFYAGSHGFEIVQPNGNVKLNDEAEKIRSVIDEFYETLRQRLKNIPGALVENVKYTITVHYRLVKDEDVPRIEKIVKEVLEKYSQLKRTSGKKVFELRPKIDWDKGKAVEWILDVLCFDAKTHTAVYIGDDTTDEDAFKVIKGKGFGILVSEDQRSTEAEYLVRNPEEVRKVLEFLVGLK